MDLILIAFLSQDPLTLSHLLNILDGLLETPGRILIITSNHPEKLDEALVRPGTIPSDRHPTSNQFVNLLLPP